ncbi:HAMP domain-containing histidine kinase [Lachnospiraceae bacterium OttesenSCG-928-D06]|nr:HAMP domain-containing histidine kinase [Lachnospiraceae bacterium OttesenSCG-928-D06]
MEKQAFLSPVLKTDTLEHLSLTLIETTNRLNESNKNLLALKKEREEILANISHDLRAPINAIRSSLDLFYSSTDHSQEEIASLFHLINQRTLILESLIQDMYYLFSLEDPMLSLEMETVQAALFLEEYFYTATVDHLYSERNMILDIAEDLDCMIQIDLPKFVRALDNLLTNSAKYSCKGDTITLQAALSPTADSLCIHIIDTGIGISPDFLPHIFNRTYTVSKARTPGETSSTGLGLSIVKAVVEKHNGCICCESKEGKGSRFTITLPLFVCSE